MLDPELTRKNEINFLALCLRLEAYRNKPTDITAFIKSMTYFIKFDFKIIYQLTTEIYDRKYQPEKIELMMLAQQEGLTQQQIARQFKLSRVTVSRRFKEAGKILYPRCTKEQAKELNKFMEGLKQLLDVNYMELI